MTTGEAIAQARQALGWTRYRLSKESGVQRKHLQMIEDGKTEPTIKTLRKLTAALGTNIQI